MYDIITLEPNDEIVATALKLIEAGKSNITNPGGNYVVRTPSGAHQVGNGGTAENILVIVGHGSPESVSGRSDWASYQKLFSAHEIDWTGKQKVFVAACSTAGQGNKFLYGNFAGTVKKAFPNAVVWAASSEVTAEGLWGEWQKID